MTLVIVRDTCLGRQTTEVSLVNKLLYECGGAIPFYSMTAPDSPPTFSDAHDLCYMIWKCNSVTGVGTVKFIPISAALNCRSMQIWAVVDSLFLGVYVVGLA